MLSNLWLDFAVGSVPLLGDMFKADRCSLEVILDRFGMMVSAISTTSIWRR